MENFLVSLLSWYLITSSTVLSLWKTDTLQWTNGQRDSVNNGKIWIFKLGSYFTQGIAVQLITRNYEHNSAM